MNHLLRQLYHNIQLDKINDSKENIIIIADDILNQIPFETLQKAKGRIFFEDYTIAYGGSLRMFVEQRSHKRTKVGWRNWVGFSPNYTDSLQLFSNEEEVLRIRKIIPSHAFVGAEATKSNFQSQASKASIVHLAMHT